MEDFVSLLKENNITKIIDIRLRNTSQLSGFAKKRDLKFILEKFLDIGYIHDLDLAPTKDILTKYKKDKNWDEYVLSFNNLMKERKMDKILDEYIDEGENVCLLCSENKPKKCHRRLLAEYYRKKKGNIKIKHL